MTARTLSIIIFALFLSMLTYVLQLSNGSVYEMVLVDFNIQPDMGAVFFASLFVVYALMQFIGAFGLMYFGVDSILTLSLLGLAFALQMTGHAGNSLSYLILVRFLMGLFMSCLFICSVKLIRSVSNALYFPALLASLDIVGVGAVCFGEKQIVNLIQQFGWRRFYVDISWLTFALVAYYILFLSNGSKKSAGSSKALPDMLFRLKKALCDHTVWKNGLVSGILFSIATVICGLLLKPYLSVKYGLDIGQSSIYSQIMLAGMLTGMTLSGVLARSLEKAKFLVVMGCITGSLSMLTFAYIPTDYFYLFKFVIFMLGLTGGSFVACFLIADVASLNVDKDVFVAVTNGICYLVTPAIQIIFGILVTYLSHYYSIAGAYRICFSLYGILIMLAGVSMHRLCVESKLTAQPLQKAN